MSIQEIIEEFETFAENQRIRNKQNEKEISSILRKIRIYRISLTQSNTSTSTSTSTPILDLFGEILNSIPSSSRSSSSFSGINNLYGDQIFRVLAESFTNQGEPQRIDILNEAEFNIFPTLTVENSISEFLNESCTICLDQYKIGDIVTKLPCNHIFHKEHIKHNLLNTSIRPECPVCRRNVRIV